MFCDAVVASSIFLSAQYVCTFLNSTSIRAAALRASAASAALMDLLSMPLTCWISFMWVAYSASVVIFMPAVGAIVPAGAGAPAGAGGACADSDTVRAKQNSKDAIESGR